jgi:hypothetical protein
MHHDADPESEAHLWPKVANMTELTDYPLRIESIILGVGSSRRGGRDQSTGSPCSRELPGSDREQPLWAAAMRAVVDDFAAA